MPDSVFDLGGSLTIDTEQLKTISDAVRDELAKVDQKSGTAKINVDDAQAKSSLRDMGTAMEDLRKAVEKKHTLQIDTSKAQSQAKSFGDSLAEDIFGPSRKSLESLEARVGEMKQGGGIGSFLKGTGGLAVGGTMMAGGISGAVALGSMAIKSAYATDLMERSTEQVFGAAAESYKAEAEKMADATGFLTTEILAAQIAMNKSAGMAGWTRIRTAPGGPGGRYRRHHGAPWICERPAGGHQRRLCRPAGLGRGAA